MPDDDDIETLRALIELLPVDTHPEDYARFQFRLGLALQAEAAEADTDEAGVECLDQAMTGFLSALLVYSPLTDLRLHADTIACLADAFHARVARTPEALRGDVFAALRPVTRMLLDATIYSGIPTRMPEEPPARSGIDVTTDHPDHGWIPDSSLFDEYLRDRYKVMPLHDLMRLITHYRSEAGNDAELSVRLLRVAIERPDVVSPVLRAQLLDELALALREIPGDDVIGRQEESLALLRRALDEAGGQPNADLLFTIHNHLARAFAERLTGDPAENLERAIAHCRTALETQPRGTHERALANAMLGQLYRDRRFGNPRDNIAEAADAFARALTVWTPKRAPYESARVNNSLGLLYLQSGDSRAEVLEAAIRAFDDALKVLTRKKHPYEWAGVVFNRANAWQRRRDGKRSDNIERAIGGFNESLTVRTREAYPSDWARTHHNLGQAYRHRLRGDRADSLRRAAGHFRTALEVHTLGERPADHRATAGALGEIEAARGDWAAAHEAFASAAAASDRLTASVTTGAHGLDDISSQGHEVGELDAYALVRLGRLDEAVEAVERGRARSLAQAFALRRADPGRISDPERRQRFLAAREELAAAEAAVNDVRWRRSARHGDARGGGLERESGSDAAAGRHDAGTFTLTDALRAARERFDAVADEIRRERDPADFLDEPLSAAAIATGIDRPVVYLLTTGFGGLALAVPPASQGADAPPAVMSCELPELTDDAMTDLVQTLLTGGNGELVGGYAAGQEGRVIDWIAGQWPGETFAAKARSQHAAVSRTGAAGTFDDAAQAMLRADHPGLAQILHKPLRDLTPEEVGRLSATLDDAVLRLELDRCLPVLDRNAIRPLTAWLREHGLTGMTLVPCGVLPAFPLLATADGIIATTAPSARSVMRAPAPAETAKPAAPGRPNARQGVYTLGDPRPTHQELRWGEAEALAVATIAGAPERARVRETATREWLVTSLRDGEVVTASCHGSFDSGDFLRSRLLLAGGEALTLAEMLGGNIDLRGLRLLMLSACQTSVMALRGAHGEVRSLAVAMLQAGARAVVGSLWPVDDRATFLLMVRFAQEWLPGMRENDPAAALARAQAWLRTVTQRELAHWEISSGLASGAVPDGSALAEVRGRGTRYTAAEAQLLISGLAGRAAAGAPDQAPYADPFYWAGFQIYGS